MDERTSQEATPSRGASAPAPASPPAFDPRDLIPTPLFCVSPEGRLVWMNAAAEALTGRHPASVAGDAFTVLLPEESRRRAARHIARRRRQGVTEYYFETPIVTAGADSHWVGLHVRLATAANGRSAWVCAAHDLHEIHASLEQLARRNRELTARLDEARAGVELKSTFLATMSSELRAPMSGVIGMTRLLLDSSLDRDQRTWAEVIQVSGDQLLDLVDDILDYSRIESGTLAIRSMDFDVRVTVDAVAALLATRAQQAGVHFSSLVHHRVPSLVNGDPGRIRQVLLHLAGCALDEAQGGEIQLRVELVEETAHQAVIRFWVNRVGGELEVDPAVETGLLAAYSGEPMPDGTPARVDARGLGLTIARRLVTLMGGDGGASRVGDMGSKLWFRVPLGKQADGPAIETPSAAGNVASVRALVVDGDGAARANVREAITSWGGTCDEAEGGLEAIEKLAGAGDATPYGALLVDLEVAELDAESLARAVRADATLAALPLVLLTAMGRPGDAARAESWGYDAYFVKPVDARELESALAALVGRGAGQGARLVTRHTVAEMRKRGIRVLVVEDNAIDQLVIASALRRVGYTPEIAPSLEEATAAIARHAADIVFVDLASAGEDGPERAARLRAACDAASRGGTRTPIVALVGRVRDEEREQCRVAGIDDLLGKPVDLEALVATVGRWVETRGSARFAVESVEEVPTTPAAEPAAAVEAAIESEDAIVPAAPVARPDGLESSDSFAALPVLDATCLDAASMGNVEIRGLLVDAFLTRTRQPLDRLRKAGEWKDIRALGIQAHAMRGMCQSVGAVRCAAALGQVEALALAGRLDDALAALERIDDELAAVRAEWDVAKGDGGSLARAA